MNIACTAFLHQNNFSSCLTAHHFLFSKTLLQSEITSVFCIHFSSLKCLPLPHKMFLIGISVRSPSHLSRCSNRVQGASKTWKLSVKCEDEWKYEHVMLQPFMEIITGKAKKPWWDYCSLCKTHQAKLIRQPSQIQARQSHGCDRCDTGVRWHCL